MSLDIPLLTASLQSLSESRTHVRLCHPAVHDVHALLLAELHHFTALLLAATFQPFGTKTDLADQSNKGVTNDVPFRDARGGHYFSYLMQTGGQTDLSIRLKYWGQDEWKNCDFDIYVDDQLVKSVNNTHKWKTSQWKYEEYPIPAEELKESQG